MHLLTNQVHPPLMCSLVDRVSEPKDTQVSAMLSLTCHLDDLCYFIKVTDTEISHNRGDFRFTNYKRKIAAQ